MTLGLDVFTEKERGKFMSIKSATTPRGLVFDTITFGYLLGVLFYYLVQPSQESLLNLTAIAISTIVFLVIGLAISVVLAKMNVLTLGQHIFEPGHVKAQREPKSLFKSFWGWELIVSFAVTLVVGAQATELDLFELLDIEGFAGAQRIFGAMLTPEWSVLPRGILAIVETIFIAFMATVIAIPAAFVLAFFAAKNIMSANKFTSTIYVALRTFLNITRSIEPLIWAIIFSVWVGIGPFAGMLALMFHSVASLTKQYSEMIESVDEGPIEGIAATGASFTQVVWFAIVPQIILPYISFTIYRWDINVRMATIIGLVGGGGIGTLLIQYQGQALWHEVGTLALLIVIVVWLMDIASAHLREALK